MTDTRASGLAYVGARGNLARAIGAVLDRHGVAKQDQLRKLAEVTGVNYAGVRRRMLGQTQWQVSELLALATFFGESAQTLIGHLIHDTVAVPAVVEFNGLAVPCSVWLGPLFNARTMVAQWVALPSPKKGDPWRVLPSESSGGRKAYCVRSLIYDGNTAYRSVAVVDPSRKFVDDVVQLLQERGIRGNGFSNLTAMQASMMKYGYDGFLISSKLLQRDAHGVLGGIRVRCLTAGIIVLLQGVEPGSREERQLHSAAAEAGALTYDRAASPASLLGALRIGFATAALLGSGNPPA